MKQSEESLSRIRDLLYAKTGIYLRDEKLRFLERRVDARARNHNITSTRDYYRFLHLDRSGEELQELVDATVVPETYFFRNYPQLKLLAEQVLPEVTEEKRKTGERGLNLLSAGCSTGEEPYTLAIILREMLDDLDAWNIRIDAIDINRKSLQKAQEGRYGSRALRETPLPYRGKYFERKGEEYILDSDVAQMVTFQWMNLFDGVAMSRLPSYDIILCRNVLIYFDHNSASKVMGYFYEIMSRGAVIFLGAAESVGRLTNLFQMVRMERLFIYRK